ncbi:actin-like protein arp8 [Borealophlyctis nickersoniae]|nr:actin-like protein arp8 [Borealophlyctis nickersoniae]
MANQIFLGNLSSWSEQSEHRHRIQSQALLAKPPPEELGGVVPKIISDSQAVQEQMPRSDARRQPQLKFSSIPIRQGYGNWGKGVQSSYLKTPGQSLLFSQQEPESVVPDPELGFNDIVVIHPGSRNLRIGRAADAVPKEVPHVIVRKLLQPRPIATSPLPSPSAASSSTDPSSAPSSTHRQYPAAGGGVTGPFYGEIRADPSHTQVIEQDIKARIRARKIRAVPNAHAQVLGYNAQSVPDTILDHNDPYRIEWTESKDWTDYVVGIKALRVPELNSTHPAAPYYRAFYPIQHGLFNTADYASLRTCLADMQIIWTEAIEQELKISRKDFGSYNVVYVIPDLYAKVIIRETMNLLLNDMGFRAVVMLQYGGDDITAFLMTLLSKTNFPYKDCNLLSNAYDWMLAEELKEKLCTVNEVDMTVNVFDFYVRAPEHPTLQYKVKVYDEPVIAPMLLFYPQIIDFPRKLNGLLYNDTFLDYNAEDEGDEEIGAQAAAAATDAYNTYLQTTNGAVGQAETTSAADETATTASRVPPPMHFLRRRRALGTLPALTSPLDFAIAQSISSISSQTDNLKDLEERVRKLCSSVLVVGGGGMITGLPKLIEERAAIYLQQSPVATKLSGGTPAPGTVPPPSGGPAFATPPPMVPPGNLLPALAPSVIQSPRDIDPRVLVWKGASVFGKLDSVSEMWVGKKEWANGGVARCLGKWCVMD